MMFFSNSDEVRKIFLEFGIVTATIIDLKVILVLKKKKKIDS